MTPQEAARTALAHVLMEYDAGRIVVEPEPGMAVPPGGKPTRFHRAWADAILTALAADRLALSGITEERLAAILDSHTDKDGHVIPPLHHDEAGRAWYMDAREFARAILAALREKP